MHPSKHKKQKFNWFPYLMMLPAWTVILGITAYPFFYSFAMSFFDFSFLKVGMNFVGLKNYIDIINEGKFLTTLGFTMLWTILNVTFMTILGFAVALLMRQQFIGKSFLKATMLIPWVLPQVVTGYIYKLMLATDTGIITNILKHFKIVSTEFSWFAETGPATCAVLMANIWRGFPFIALMLYAKMQTVPDSQLEAASIDGANGYQKFIYIMLPYITPVVSTSVFLTFLWSFNAFDIIKVMTDGGPLNTTNTLALLVNREAFSYLEISRACTMAVFMLLILLACVGILLLFRKIIIQLTTLKKEVSVDGKR